MLRLRRLFAVSLFFAALAALWGCDASNLPTAVPIQPASSTATAYIHTATLPAATFTANPSSTAVPSSTPQPPPSTVATTREATATTEPAPATTNIPTPTEIVEATQTQALPAAATVTPRLTVTPSPQPAEEDNPPTALPLATSTEIASVGDTETPAATLVAKPTIEAAPSNGWKELVRVPAGGHKIAVTFDAGSTGETIPAVLQALRERNLHITMFITGKFAEQYPDGIRQAAADGNEIANHTYSHLDSIKLTDDQLKNELDRTESILYNLTGRTTKPYWRPPLGSRNPHVLNVAVADGYRSIYWTLDSLDSVGQPKTPEFIYNRVTSPPPGVQLDGAIVLLHFGSAASAEALPRILDRLKEMGLDVVTVSDLLSP